MTPNAPHDPLDAWRALADEQAALRRVATLVAHETPPQAVFAAVAREVGELLGVEATHLGRFEADGTVVSIAQWGSRPGIAVGARFPLEGDSVSARVLRAGQPTRMDGYGDAPGVIASTVRGLGICVSIGVPIVVEGRTWGVMIASSREREPFPAETEARLQDFTELMATAISNAEARAEAARLTNEQAALRRVATLVAQGPPAGAVFDAVAAEVGALLGASAVTLARYDGDALVVVATRGRARYVQIGARYPLGGTNVTSTVLRTGKAARLDDYGEASGQIGDIARRSGIRSTVAAPVAVDGRIWGVLVALWGDREPPHGATEQRMARFAQLLDTAIANADSRDQLNASRARVLAAGDEGRRRVVRELHDGAQQRLVQTIMQLRLAQEALAEDDRAAAEPLIAEALGTAERAMAELRELARGILPSALAHGGLRAGVNAFVARLELPVEVDVVCDRLPPDIEASAYFIVAEALADVARHARATRAWVAAAVRDGLLAIDIRDDGVGGDGHGLVQLGDRVDALGGRMRMETVDGGGTAVVVRLPLPAPGGRRGAGTGSGSGSS